MSRRVTVNSQRKRISPLSRVMRYQNEEVLHKFRETFSQSKQQAQDLFDEIKRWLWLCAHARQERQQGNKPPKMVIQPCQQMMDEMWHTFILFTRDYRDFCFRHFGYFVDHFPTERKEKRRFEALKLQNPELAAKAQAEEYRAYYRYVYEKLGERTLRKWFEVFPKKYTPEIIGRLRINPQELKHASRLRTG